VDWEHAVTTFGPTGALIIFLLKAHHDLVHKTIPEGMHAIRKEIVRSRLTQERLVEVVFDIRHRQGRVSKARKPLPKPKKLGQTRASKRKL